MKQHHIFSYVIRDPYEDGYYDIIELMDHEFYNILFIRDRNEQQLIVRYTCNSNFISLHKDKNIIFKYEA